MVCDGFTGNVTLKAMEGAAEFLLREINQAAHSGIRARIGAGLFKRALQPLRRQERGPEGYGGAYLVGLRGLSVIAHGSSLGVRYPERHPAWCERRSKTRSWSA